MFSVRRQGLGSMSKRKPPPGNAGPLKLGTAMKTSFTETIRLGAEVRVLFVLRKSAAVKHDIVPVDVSTQIDIARFEVARIKIRQSHRIGPLFLGGQSHSVNSGTALAFGRVKLERKLVRGANGAPFHRVDEASCYANR